MQGDNDCSDLLWKCSRSGPYLLPGGDQTPLVRFLPIIGGLVHHLLGQVYYLGIVRDVDHVLCFNSVTSLRFLSVFVLNDLNLFLFGKTLDAFSFLLLVYLSSLE